MVPKMPTILQTSEESDPFSDAEVEEQWPCEQNAAASHRRPGQIVPCEKRSGVCWVGQREVDKYALQDRREFDIRSAEGHEQIWDLNPWHVISIPSNPGSVVFFFLSPSSSAVGYS